MWGSAGNNERGETICEMLEDINSLVLNNGSATYCRDRDGQCSCLDLSIASGNFAKKILWTTCE